MLEGKFSHVLFVEGIFPCETDRMFWEGDVRGLIPASDTLPFLPLCMYSWFPLGPHFALAASE